MATILKKFWVPEEEELKELENKTNEVKRSYRECRMMAEWAGRQAKINATIKAANNKIKNQCDEIIARGNEATCKNTTTRLTGQIMADMTSESR